VILPSAHRHRRADLPALERPPIPRGAPLFAFAVESETARSPAKDPRYTYASLSGASERFRVGPARRPAARRAARCPCRSRSE
jgi:hypothetical protein